MPASRKNNNNNKINAYNINDNNIEYIKKSRKLKSEKLSKF